MTHFSPHSGNDPIPPEVDPTEPTPTAADAPGQAVPFDHEAVEVVGRGPRKALVIDAQEIGGKTYVAVRVWRFAMGRWLPTRAGLVLERGEVQRVLRALPKAARLAAERNQRGGAR